MVVAHNGTLKTNIKLHGVQGVEGSNPFTPLDSTKASKFDHLEAFFICKLAI
jgi:acetylornithine deacetylase/succinyl-diaminopimelate desuccinylase-like protein